MLSADYFSVAGRRDQEPRIRADDRWRQTGVRGRGVCRSRSAASARAAGMVACGRLWRLSSRSAPVPAIGVLVAGPRRIRGSIVVHDRESGGGLVASAGLFEFGRIERITMRMKRFLSSDRAVLDAVGALCRRTPTSASARNTILLTFMSGRRISIVSSPASWPPSEGPRPSKASLP